MLKDCRDLNKSYAAERERERQSSLFYYYYLKINYFLINSICKEVKITAKI